MRIGLYFGSFNPIHTGHLVIANAVANEKIVDKIWFVVSPQNPLKSNNLLNKYDRLNLVQLAIETDERFKASDIEFSLPTPSYTIDTLTYLHEKYPFYSFYIIMGSDSFNNLPRWKGFEVLRKNYNFIVYQRSGEPLIETSEDNSLSIRVLQQVPLMDIASSYIRQLIKKGCSARYLLPEKVWEEIDKNNYYK